MTQAKITTISTVAVIFAVLFFTTAVVKVYADDSSSGSNSGSSDSGGSGSSSDKSSGSSDNTGNDNNGKDSASSPSQPTQTQPTQTPIPVPQGPQQPNDCPHNASCTHTHPFCQLHPCHPHPVVIVVKKTVNHHTTVVREPTTTTTKLSVTQQNCIAGALQLGFTSNADNRADATYAAVLGCFS